MRKTVLSAIAVFLGGGWGFAQQTQPGYSFVTSTPKPSGSAVVTPTAATPPEPGVVSAMPAPMPTMPPMSPLGSMGPMGPMAGPMGPMPIGMPMNGAAGMPYTTDPGPMYGNGAMPGCATDFGAGYYDPPSSFGTERVWISAHYLLGYLSRPGLSTPLVVGGSTTDLHPGALDQPGTVVLFGRDQYQFNPLHGIQLDAGVNLNDRIYIEGSVKYFAPQHTNAMFVSDAAGNPFFGRPIFSTLVGQERAFLTASPGIASGFTNVQSRLQLFSIEAHARYQVNLTPYLSSDFLLGVRRMQLEEELEITDSLTPIGGSITFLGAPVVAPNTVSDFDRFATANKFNGINTGLRFRWQSGFPCFALAGYGKLAVGQTTQSVEIEGVSGTTAPVPVPTAVGGILALPSNIGRYERDVFGIIPEGGAQLVFLLSPGCRFYMGYTATYWNDVVRPGDQIDRRVNPAQVPTDLNFSPTATRNFPAFEWRSTSVWLQTINWGLEFYY